jgi:hypothetical protein
MEKNNNLRNSQRGGLLETLVLTLAPLLAWIIAKCVLCTAIVVVYLLVVRFVLNRKASIEVMTQKTVEFKKGAKVLFVLTTIACALFILWHTMVFNAINADTNKEPETVEVQPEKQKEEVEADDKTEETSTSTQGDPNARRTANGALDKHGKYTNNDGSLKDEIKVTKEANDPTKAKPEAKTTTGKTENTIKVEDCKSDIVVITTPAKEDKNVEETKSVDPAKDINVNEVEIKDIPSNENKAEETTISNEVEDDKVVEMDKDELAELFKNVKEEEKSEKAAPKAEEPKVEVKEDVETKTEAVVKTEEVVEETIVNEEAKGDVKVEEAVTLENETPVIEEKVEVKSIEAVKVTAIDGYNATVGSTIQFKVSGDDVKIDGLDGINYTFNNGILSVNTGSEATVLTVEASNSVNTVSFDIVINGIAQ